MNSSKSRMTTDASSPAKMPRGITYLDFSKKISGFDKVLSLSTFIKANSTVENIDISYNNISDDELKILCNGIRRNKTLRILNLSGNSISGTGAAMLLDVLNKESSNIFVLNLSNNKIDDDGFSKMVEMLKTNTALNKLFVDCK